MKNNPLAYFVGGAVICAVLLAFVTRDKWRGTPDAVQTAAATAQSGETKQPAAQQNESTKTVKEVAPATPPAKEPAQQQAAVEPKAEPAIVPSVDNVVIVDGLAIVSGHAKAGAKVKIVLNDKIAGKATVAGELVANDLGDWYLSPEPTLEPGKYNFEAVSTTEDGKTLRSAPSSIVVINEPAKPEPQQIAEAEPAAKEPEPQQTAEAEPVAKEPESQQTAKAETVTKQPVAEEKQPVAQEKAPAEPAAEQQVAAVDATSQEPPPKPEPTPMPVVKVDPEPRLQPVTGDNMKLDYTDTGDFVISGKSNPSGKLRVYIDNQPVGDTTADADGRWVFADGGNIAPGVRDLRVDQMLNSGKVIRGETFPIKREDPVKVAAPQPEPAKEAETVVIKTPEPAAPATTATQPTQAETQQSGSGTQAAAAPAAEPQEAQPADETTTASIAAEPEPAAPAKAEPAPSMLSAQGRVVIQPGNNLWNISRVIYGRGIEYTTIYEANKDQIRNPHWIYPGQIFMTPGTVPPEEIDPKRREPIAMDEKQAQ